MPAAQQFRRGPEHRMDRGDVGAGCAQRFDATPQGALERADVEHHARRRALGERLEDPGGGAQLRGDDHELVIERLLREVIDEPTALDGPRRIRDIDRESLRRQKPHEPAAHLATAADHQRALPAAVAGRRDAFAFLHRERGTDQRDQQLFRDRWRHAVLETRGTGALEHLAFLQVVARREPQPSLLLADLGGEGEAFADAFDDVAVDLCERASQFVERHGSCLS